VHRPVADAFASALNGSSEVYAGGSLTFYSLADVLQEVYTDPTTYAVAASTSGVLTLNSAGRPPLAYFNHTLDYKAILKDSSGTTIGTINPIFKAAGFLTSSSLTPYLLKAGGTMTGVLNFAEGAAITAAASIDLDAATGNMVHIAGSTGISTMTLAQGAWRILVFDSTPAITHSSNLILPGAANITAAAGDIMVVVGEGSGVTRCVDYTLASGKPLIESAEILIAVGDESTAITTGTAKITFRMPFAMTLNALPRASLTAASTGSAPAIDINESGASIFSTTLTIDANELTSETAATPAVLSDTALADNAQMTIDIDTAGTNAAGLKVLLRGYRHNRS
jgi:hypothetical protein